MADSLRARTLINLSAVLYEQAAAQTGLPAEVSNMDLDFVPGVAFIPDVHMADSLRARTLINLSAVLYEQAAARTSLPAEVSNISPRARTLINLSAVLYEQADARFSLSAEVGIMDLDFVPGVAFNAIGNVELTGDFLTALLNPRLLALKRPALSGSDLDCRRTDPTIATLPAKRIKTDEDCKKSTHRQGFNGGSIGDNIEELIYVGKVKHTYVLFCRAGNNRNNLNIMVTNPTGREFGRVDMKSSTGLSGEGPLGSLFSGLISMTLQLYCKRKWAHDISKFYKGKNIQLLRPIFKLYFQTNQFTQQELTLGELGSIYVLRSVDEIWADVADVFDTVISKSDKDKEQDYSAEEHDQRKDTLWALRLRDNSRKFYRLVITGEDTHYKQTIKKAYIMSLERASLILFMI
ncbi:hypothetical protein HBI69_134500 [Parastagonospora nodorum]|nr:hypothetical protein HBI69_134500 [Parastagonospora nodorum]